MDGENTNEQPTKLKPKKPRTEAQVASLERARLKAMEMRATRFKDTPEPDDSDDEPEPEDEPASEPEPEKPVAEKKPRKPRKPKAKPVEPVEPVESKPEPEPVEPEREDPELRQFRKEVQEAPPPTPKQHFRLMHSFKKSYMLFHE